MGIETGLLIAGLALSAGSAIKQGMDAKDTADANANLLTEQAAADKDAAISQADRIRKAQKYAISQANAANAASGVAIGEGSALRINEQIYRDSESDAYNTLLTGERRAKSSTDQGAIVRRQGVNAETAGYLTAGASVLSAGAKNTKGYKTSKNNYATDS